MAALTRRGRCYQEQGNFPAAKEDYFRALQIYPESALVKEALGRIEREEKRASAKAGRARARPRVGGTASGTKRAQERAAERARKEAEDLRRVKGLKSFEEAYSLGVAASKSSRPDYPLAIKAFRKAYELDPRRKVRPEQRPDPRLFEVPTRLAAAYRANGQLYEAQKTYEWVLKHQDSRFAKVGLAAVHEDNGKPLKALRLYEEVLFQDPDDAHALRGIAKVFSDLGRVEEAVEAYEKAAELARSRGDLATATAGLEKMREALRSKGETDQAEWINPVLKRLLAD